jgi:hypothetical protein
MLASLNALLAFGLAGVLLGAREVMHRRWLKSGAESSAYLLLCPNLTLVALAANVLLERSAASQPAAWLLLAGLFVTVPAISFLPAEPPVGPPAPPQAPAGDSPSQRAVQLDEGVQDALDEQRFLWSTLIIFMFTSRSESVRFAHTWKTSWCSTDSM